MTFTSTTPCRLHSLWQELCSHPYARWRADAICRGCRPEDLPQRLHQDDAAALRALIAARNGATSEFAGMALIQAILPTLVMIASRDRQACLDDYIGEAWMVITNFPLSRTNKVYTNVVWTVCMPSHLDANAAALRPLPNRSTSAHQRFKNQGGWRRTCSVQLRSLESSPRLAHQYCEVCGWTRWIALLPHNVTTPVPPQCELDALERAGPCDSTVTSCSPRRE